MIPPGDLLFHFSKMQIRRALAFGLELIQPPPGPGPYRGRDEEFVGCIRQHKGADLPAIQHNVIRLSHGTLRLGQLDAHRWNGADIRCALGDLLRTYEAGDILSVEVGMLHAPNAFCVDLRLSEQRDHGVFIKWADALAQCLKGHSPIHSARIEVENA